VIAGHPDDARKAFYKKFERRGEQVHVFAYVTGDDQPVLRIFRQRGKRRAILWHRQVQIGNREKPHRVPPYASSARLATAGRFSSSRSADIFVR